MEKILVIALHKLGDNLQVTPVFRVLKRRFPSSHITVLTEKPFQFPFECNPFIDAIRFFDRKRYTGNGVKTLIQARTEKEGDVALLAESNLDLILNRHSSFEGAALASAIGAREIRGLWMREDNSAAYEDPWTRLLFAGCQCRSVNAFNFVDYGINAAGGWEGERRLDLFAPAQDARELLDRHQIGPGCRVITLQPGSNSPLRRWSSRSFALAAGHILAKGEEYRVVLLGSPGEAPLAKEILDQTADKDRSRVADLTSSVPLSLLPGLLKQCAALITNDTGPMHVAAAVGCPVIALYFGESFVNETGPFGRGNIVIHAQLPCLPCTYVTKCSREYACREMVKPEHAAALVTFLEGRTGSLDPDFFSGTAVHFSGREALLSEIRYRPLLKPVATPEDILRAVYRTVFRKHLSGAEPDIQNLAGQLDQDYAKADEGISRMTDLNVQLVNLYSRNKAESDALLALTRDVFIGLRSILDS